MNGSAEMETAPLLRIVDLGHCYAHGGQEERVFSGLSAEVFPGELVCLIGRSGCGKSTVRQREV